MRSAVFRKVEATHLRCMMLKYVRLALPFCQLSSLKARVIRVIQFAGTISIEGSAKLLQSVRTNCTLSRPENSSTIITY